MTLLAPGVARADDESVIDTHRHNTASPQNFLIEVRAAPYSPRVDDAPGLTGTPYHDAFGGSAQLYLGAEFDWQALRIPYLGTIGPGVGAGFVNISARAAKRDGTGLSGENTNLDIYPYYAVAVLRADVLMRQAHVPLVPYAKAGVAVALWRASNDGGGSVSVNGVSGKGTTWGSQFALGISLSLNAFDQHAARELDNATGINNTYLYAEYMMSELTGLGQKGTVLYVGTRSPVFGMAWEF